MRHFRNMDGPGAAKIFNAVLAKDPPVAVAAKCHIYLGLIALNGLDPEAARGEFKQAIDLDPTAEPPVSASPKAWRLFNQVRTEGTAQAAPPPPPPPAPESVVVVDNKPPPMEASLADEAAPRPSHLPAYLVGGVGVAALIAGIAFGAASNGTESSAKSATVATSAESLGSQVGTERLAADVLFGVAVAGGVTAVVLFLTERSSSPVSAAVSPTPGGAQLSVGGSF